MATVAHDSADSKSCGGSIVAPATALTAVGSTETNKSILGTGYVAEPFQPKGIYTRERVFSTNADTTEDASLEYTVEEEQANGLAGTNIDDTAVLPLPLKHVDSPWFELHPMDEIPSEADILEHDVRLLHKAHHADPFSVLGPHFFDYPGEQLKCIVIR